MILVVRTKGLSCQSKTLALKIDSVIIAGHIPGSIRFFACIALWRVCRVSHRLLWMKRVGDGEKIRDFAVPLDTYRC